MKIKDIKNGQIVELRNGTKYYRFNRVLINNSGHNEIIRYNNDTMLMIDREVKNLDIVKVYAMSKDSGCMHHITHVDHSYNTVFERKN